jgi:hypothetical protein
MISILTEEKLTDVQPEVLSTSNVLAANPAAKSNRVLLWNIAWMLVGNLLYGFSHGHS